MTIHRITYGISPGSPPGMRRMVNRARNHHGLRPKKGPIYLIKQQPPRVMDAFRSHAIGEVGVSSITVSELWYGVAKSKHREANAQALEQFLLPLIVSPFDDRAGQAYGEIRAALEKQGQSIGAMDLLIAAHAVSLGVRLVTKDKREFARVPNLIVENWAQAADKP